MKLQVENGETINWRWVARVFLAENEVFQNLDPLNIRGEKRIKKFVSCICMNSHRICHERITEETQNKNGFISWH
jgi:hypothetical protein